MTELSLRAARPEDLDALCALEQRCFSSDRLSRRRLRHWIAASNRELLIALRDGVALGYGLALLHRGTRLARLYSLAVAPEARGLGLGKQLLTALEAATARRGRLYMRLEVAEDNQQAIGLYQSLGYQRFGTWNDYYEDHQNALRMQKRIRYVPENLQANRVPWYQQTTPFTCGPAAAMMAMASLRPTQELSRGEELDLWREATTIYMTAGHGGCHPVGLALAAQRRGFKAQALINRQGPLFLDGVRSSEKKALIELVHERFIASAQDNGVTVRYQDVSQDDLARWVARGAMILVLISTWRLDRKKAPHWVAITAIDEECLYINDPDPGDDQSALDCQSMPIARSDFDRMSLFGRDRLRTAVVIENARAD